MLKTVGERKPEACHVRDSEQSMFSLEKQLSGAAGILSDI